MTQNSLLQCALTDFYMCVSLCHCVCACVCVCVFTLCDMLSVVVQEKAPREKREKGEKQEHKCTECGATFLRANNLKLHLQRHNGDKPHVCNQCGAAFVEARNLKRHQVTHKVAIIF